MKKSFLFVSFHSQQSGASHGKHHADHPPLGKTFFLLDPLDGQRIHRPQPPQRRPRRQRQREDGIIPQGRIEIRQQKHPRRRRRPAFPRLLRHPRPRGLRPPPDLCGRPPPRGQKEEGRRGRPRPHETELEGVAPRPVLPGEHAPRHVQHEVSEVEQVPQGPVGRPRRGGGGTSVAELRGRHARGDEERPRQRPRRAALVQKEGSRGPGHYGVQRAQHDGVVGAQDAQRPEPQEVPRDEADEGGQHQHARGRRPEGEEGAGASAEEEGEAEERRGDGAFEAVEDDRGPGPGFEGVDAEGGRQGGGDGRGERGGGGGAEGGRGEGGCRAAAEEEGGGERGGG
mmetsp:Transcript_16320/g.36717  ORF Transcript_16320/g.36717 Transcript_16320/m.36717 type:complete len:341 (+) Transcript_16320:42-1064(+)